ncbi:MAG: HAD-IC family P-type ATPase [Gammaproteobacteria bacterium]|nr:HAD-IC family P-type ATPase [Gammaproteobacteria bacterium]
MQKTSWYALPTKDVLEQFNTQESGLTRAIIHRQRKKYGRNLLKIAKTRGPFLRLLSQFNNILIYMLLASAMVTIFLRHWVDTSVILGVVVLNALIGFIQEGKAEKALKAISKLLSPQALVIRNGRHYVIPAEGLVPGDIVLLKSGDRVPADLRLLTTKSLRIDEAILTGESTPIDKSPQKVNPDSPLYSRTSMAYSGTMVTHGIGKGVVTAIGDQTEIGKISTMLTKISTLVTPLMRQITRFGRWLTAGIVLMSVVAFVAGVVFRNYSVEQMFMAAISLIVAAIPEGLPAIVTITLAVGVTRMAKQNAIIRRLPAVETMGSVDVICTDKTGTLTKNELAVQTVITSVRKYQVERGEGDDPFSGDFQSEGQPMMIDEDLDLQNIIDAAILCNEAEVTKRNEKIHLFGDPIDKALLVLGYQSQVDISFKRHTLPRNDFIPFESQHKFMASLHHDHQGHGYIYVKGSPELLLKVSRYQLSHGQAKPLDTIYWSKHLDKLASHGLRVIGIAMKKTKREHLTLNFQDVDKDFIFLGLLGLIDPPRPGVQEAVAQCQQAGVSVKIVTGDHALTTKTIGEQIGIRDAQIVVGEALDRMSDQELNQIVGDVAIYARTSPEHKLRLVRALQSQGHVVAMTGDGVNDAPALRQANIGIAMGQKGTEATKEVAEIVLADDNFVSIAQAIEEGRTVYDNLKKAILYVLPTDIGESVVILLAILFGQIFPITPLQILWINMVTAVTLTIGLSFERAESNVMKRPPRAKDAPFLSPILIWRIFFVGFLLVICVFSLFLMEIHLGRSLAVARTVVVNMLVVGEAVYLFYCRKLYEVKWNPLDLRQSPIVLVSIVGVLILQLLFTYLPFLQHFFHTAAIGFFQWSIILGFGVVLYFLIGLERKLIAYNK